MSLADRYSPILAILDRKTNALVTCEGGIDHEHYPINFRSPKYVETTDGTKWYRGPFIDEIVAILQPREDESIVDAVRRLAGEATEREKRLQDDNQILSDQVAMLEGHPEDLGKIDGDIADCLNYLKNNPDGMIDEVVQGFRQILASFHGFIRRQQPNPPTLNMRLIDYLEDNPDNIDILVKEGLEACATRNMLLEDQNVRYKKELDTLRADDSFSTLFDGLQAALDCGMNEDPYQGVARLQKKVKKADEFADRVREIERVFAHGNTKEHFPGDIAESFDKLCDVNTEAVEGVRILEHPVGNKAISNLVSRYQHCVSQLLAMFPSDPLGESPAQFYIERLEALIEKKLLAPTVVSSLSDVDFEHMMRANGWRGDLATIGWLRLAFDKGAASCPKPVG
jgi:hypothetical protein